MESGGGRGGGNVELDRGDWGREGGGECRIGSWTFIDILTQHMLIFERFTNRINNVKIVVKHD